MGYRDKIHPGAGIFLLQGAGCGKLRNSRSRTSCRQQKHTQNYGEKKCKLGWDGSGASWNQQFNLYRGPKTTHVSNGRKNDEGLLAFQVTNEDDGSETAKKFTKRDRIKLKLGPAEVDRVIESSGNFESLSDFVEYYIHNSDDIEGRIWLLAVLKSQAHVSWIRHRQQGGVQTKTKNGIS